MINGLIRQALAVVRLGVLFAAGIAILPGCPASQDLVLVDGHGIPMVSMDRFGNIQPVVPIFPQTEPQSGLLDETNQPEFLVKDAYGTILARADGTERKIYFRGCLDRVPDLEASGSTAEFLIQDAAGVTQALIDGEGNLKYRGRIGMLLQQTVFSTENTPCGMLDVTALLDYYDEDRLRALALEVELPEGWAYDSWIGPGAAPAVSPQSGDNKLPFLWIDNVEFPVSISYRVQVADQSEGDQQICAQGLYRTFDPEFRTPTVCSEVSGSLIESRMCEQDSNDSLVQGESNNQTEREGSSIESGPGGDVGVQDRGYCTNYHSADTDHNWKIELGELNRIVQYYRSNSYMCQTTSLHEDGYLPSDEETPGSCTAETTEYCCERHGADYNPPDWKINLSELLRMIQFFNMHEYHETTAVDSEDGYNGGAFEEGDCEYVGIPFTSMRIGDADGFGWGTGAQLTQNGITSACRDNSYEPTSDFLPVNTDNTSVLRAGDYLPDMDHSDGVNLTACSDEQQTGFNCQVEYPGDDWDNRSVTEQQGKCVSGSGYRISMTGATVDCQDCYNYEGELAANSSDYTDVALSRSYDMSRYLVEEEGEAPACPESCEHPCEEAPADRLMDPLPLAGLTYAPFPKAASNSGSNMPSFTFDFYVAHGAIDPNGHLYYNMLAGDYDSGIVIVRLAVRTGETLNACFNHQSSGNDGLIQGVYVPLNDLGDDFVVCFSNPSGAPDEIAGMTMRQVFQREPVYFNNQPHGWVWHGFLSVTLSETPDCDECSGGTSGQGCEPYFTLDFAEISTRTDSIGLKLVPQQFLSIQAAIDASTTGDTVLVRYPGRYADATHPPYSENIDYSGKSIMVRSLFPGRSDIAERTIIDGGGTGPVVTFAGNEESFAELAGFTVQNGFSAAGSGGGVQGNGTHARIRQNRVWNNQAYLTGGGVAGCLGVVDENEVWENMATSQWAIGGGVAECAYVRGNDIRNNFAGLAGGGIGHCVGDVIDNDISYNFAGLCGGGVAYCTGGSVFDNEIENNYLTLTTGTYGGGVAVCDHVEYNRIANNYYDSGSVLYPVDGGGVAEVIELERNSIYGNWAESRGAGVYKCRRIINNAIYDNRLANPYSGALGAGIHLRTDLPGTGNVLVLHNSLRNNTGYYPPLRMYCPSINTNGLATVVNCILWDNQSGDYDSTNNSFMPAGPPSAVFEYCYVGNIPYSGDYNTAVGTNWVTWNLDQAYYMPFGDDACALKADVNTNYVHTVDQGTASSVTVDIENQSRDYAPDVGCDEVL